MVVPVGMLVRGTTAASAPGEGKREHSSPSPDDKSTCSINLCSKVECSQNNQVCGFLDLSGGNLQQNHFHCCPPAWKQHQCGYSLWGSLTVSFHKNFYKHLIHWQFRKVHVP